MSTLLNPLDEVRRHVARSGVDLPDATVDELVAHLEDLHAAAIADGASPAEARRRALAALDESAFSLLQRHAAKHPDRREAALPSNEPGANYGCLITATTADADSRTRTRAGQANAR